MRRLLPIALTSLLLATLAPAQAMAAEDPGLRSTPAVAPMAATRTTTLPALVQSLPYVDPLYVGYRGKEQFIPAAYAAKKDKRGCNLQQRMIISLASVKPKVGAKCKMTGGRWIVDGGTKTVTSPKGLTLVPTMSFKQAWGQGAYAWSPAQRLAWATNTGPGKTTRGKAVTNQATQGLFSSGYLQEVTREAFYNPSPYGSFRRCMDAGGGIFSCILVANLVSLFTDDIAAGLCSGVVRLASNASAWGLTVDAALSQPLGDAASECRSSDLISVTDEATVNGIRPVTSVVVSPQAIVPPEPSSPSTTVFADYGAPVGGAVSGELFGLHAPVGFGNPGVQPGYVRIWDSDASWMDIEKEKGTYVWDTLSASIDNAMGAKVMYVLGYTPAWANDGKGKAAPPTNLDDAADFIGKVCQRFGAKIASYEVWNEGNLVTFWTGSMSDLASLTQKVRDKVRACGSGAQVVASSAGARADGGFATRFKDYLNELGARGWPVDAYSVHSYPSASGGPEQRLQELAQFKTMLALTGAPVKAVYDTELNYGLAGLGQGRRPIDDATGAGYMAQTFIQSVQYGVDSAFWYLWTAADYDLLGIQFNPGTSQTKQAWNTLRSWLIGSRIQRCGESGAVRECQFTGSGGPFTVIWTTDGTATVNVKGLGPNCLTLQFAACPVTNETVTAGIQPLRMTP